MTKDHPLEQVCGNPSKPVQTRRQLATDPEMCMFALTAGHSDAQRAAPWQARYNDQREIHDLRMQRAADQREFQELRDRVTALERRMDGKEE
ncbi:hypothetical protein Tco_0532569 [Tanacetum coccineum]